MCNKIKGEHIHYDEAEELLDVWAKNKKLMKKALENAKTEK